MPGDERRETGVTPSSEGQGKTSPEDPRTSPTEMMPDGTRSGSRPSAGHQPSNLQPGDVFAGRYNIVSLIGRGGFSYVFKASDRETGESVALKFLASQDAGQNLVERMRRELRLTRDLRHPNIVRVFELHEVADFYCLAMEYIEGSTLKNLIISSHPLPVQEAHRLLLQLASAIAAVHAAGVVHRDLKPQNVVVTASGEIKLLDFGLAKTPESTGLTVTGTILGTPDYMAPEQVEGHKADARSDVYALGVIAYELFVGRPPFQGDTPLSVALQHVRSRVGDPCRLRPELARNVGQLILRMTEPSPARRPASAQEVLVDLSRMMQEGNLGGLNASRPGLRRLVAAAVLALTLAGAVGGVTAWLRRGAGRPAVPAAGPFADARVTVAVMAPKTTGVVGAGAFMNALVAALEGRLVSSRVEVRKLSVPELDRLSGAPPELTALGVEEVLRLTLARSKGPEGPTYRVEAVAAGAVGGAGWRQVGAAEIRALDFEAVEVVAERIATGYLAEVEAALRRAKQDRADEENLRSLR